MHTIDKTCIQKKLLLEIKHRICLVVALVPKPTAVKILNWVSHLGARQFLGHVEHKSLVVRVHGATRGCYQSCTISTHGNKPTDV